MAENNSHSENTIQGQTPGQLLKAAREKQGLSEKEIASQLNLHIKMITALENHDKNQLPDSMYVRGYIRNYARIVNLDSEKLIGLYENDAGAPPDLVLDKKSPSETSSADFPVKAVTYLISFSLVLLLIAWLQGQHVQEKNTLDTEMPVVSGESEVMERLPDYTHPAENNTEQLFNEPAMSLDLQGSETEIYENFTGTGEPQEESMDMPAELSSDVAAADQVDQSLESLLPVNDEVKFKIKKESWIEVYDSGHNRLYMGLVKPGDEISLSGMAPFEVLLGYSPGVEVRFNGELFDPEPYSRSGIARFMLGVQNTQENTN